ncbi:MAG: DsbA family protein, partial [Pseudomonadales bacterium]|nr:DsbA family protein [Pseudomonadales bacterium]
PEVTRSVFDYIWRDGCDPTDQEAFAGLCSELEVEPGAVKHPDVKQRLLQNGKEAIACGIFGVPTWHVLNRMFWGFDATDMMVDYLHDRRMFEDEEMKRVKNLPYGARRI